MEFRLYIHFSTFNISRWSFDLFFNFLTNFIDNLENIIDSKEHYKRESLSAKIIIFTDIDFNNLIFNGEHLLTCFYNRFRDYSLYDYYIAKFIYTDCTSTPPQQQNTYIESSIPHNVTNTIFSEIFEHITNSPNNRSISFCRNSNCVLPFNLLQICKNNNSRKEIYHLESSDPSIEGLIHPLLNDIIFDPNTNSYMIPSQTFLRDEKVYKQEAGTAIYTDGNYFYKIDRTHRGHDAHVEQSYTRDFNDRRRLDAYKNLKKQRLP